jgi:hypothetical protein
MLMEVLLAAAGTEWKVRSGARRSKNERGFTRPLAQLSSAPWRIHASNLLNSQGAM